MLNHFKNYQYLNKKIKINSGGLVKILSFYGNHSNINY
jgi:hypothetical protein